MRRLVLAAGVLAAGTFAVGPVRAEEEPLTPPASTLPPLCPPGAVPTEPPPTAAPPTTVASDIPPPTIIEDPAATTTTSTTLPPAIECVPVVETTVPLEITVPLPPEVTAPTVTPPATAPAPSTPQPPATEPPATTPVPPPPTSAPSASTPPAEGPPATVPADPSTSVTAATTPAETAPPETTEPWTTEPWTTPPVTQPAPTAPEPETPSGPDLSPGLPPADDATSPPTTGVPESTVAPEPASLGPLTGTTAPAPAATPAAAIGELAVRPPPADVTPSGRVVQSATLADSAVVRDISFPVAGPVAYGNDWGVCRDGCQRRHRGIDLIGDRLQPILAMADGVVHHLVDHPTAGYGVALVDDEGWRYDVYHMNNDTPGTDDGADDGEWRFAPGIEAGTRVRAGELLGWMGDSGNSEHSVPHAHVEIHTPAGDAVNPYWSLRRAQQVVNCSIETIDTEPAPPAWLADGWEGAELPGDWMPLTLTGGTRNGAARMWIGRGTYIPVDAAALRVGNSRLDQCDAPVAAATTTSMDRILSAIRAVESGGDYRAQSRSSSASGAYQFVNGTWANFRGYARAADAPPEVQDQAAAAFVRYILERYGDPSLIPVVWYLGHAPSAAEWDRVPSPPGNVLTPRQYQARWLAAYANGSASAVPATADPEPRPACRVAAVTSPDASSLLLTLTSTFVATSDGRAAVAPSDPAEPTVVDPCDPGRAAGWGDVSASAPPAEVP